MKIKKLSIILLLSVFNTNTHSSVMMPQREEMNREEINQEFNEELKFRNQKNKEVKRENNTDQQNTEEKQGFLEKATKQVIKLTKKTLEDRKIRKKLKNNIEEISKNIKDHVLNNLQNQGAQQDEAFNQELSIWWEYNKETITEDLSEKNIKKEIEKLLEKENNSSENFKNELEEIIANKLLENYNKKFGEFRRSITREWDKFKKEGQSFNDKMYYGAVDVEIEGNGISYLAQGKKTPVKRENFIKYLIRKKKVDNSGLFSYLTARTLDCGINACRWFLYTFTYVPRHTTRQFFTEKLGTSSLDSIFSLLNGAIQVGVAALALSQLGGVGLGTTIVAGAKAAIESSKTLFGGAISTVKTAFDITKKLFTNPAEAIKDIKNINFLPLLQGAGSALGAFGTFKLIQNLMINNGFSENLSYKIGILGALIVLIALIYYFKKSFPNLHKGLEYIRKIIKKILIITLPLVINIGVWEFFTYKTSLPYYVSIILTIIVSFITFSIMKEFIKEVQEEDKKDKKEEKSERKKEERKKKSWLWRIKNLFSFKKGEKSEKSFLKENFITIFALIIIPITLSILYSKALVPESN